MSAKCCFQKLLEEVEKVEEDDGRQLRLMLYLNYRPTSGRKNTPQIRQTHPVRRLIPPPEKSWLEYTAQED